MKIQKGDTVLLTGASGGLGRFIAHALVDLQVRQVLVAHPGTNLEELRKEIEHRGGSVLVLISDLRDAAQRQQLLLETRKQVGPVDILINNAGVEFTAAYHELAEESIYDTLRVNLEAPMILSRRLLSDMLERKRGHIVNISSLAGTYGPAFQEPYAATKAGLIKFTESLRATYRGSGVSASVIIPGFVEAGIYAKLKAKSGCSAPALLGTSPPELIPRAVIRAIEKDLPEIIINPMPVRPLLALIALFPSWGEWIARKLGSNKFFRDVAEAQKQAGQG
ncbi:MAG TPA: SDR family NAD(P)-dependent oxidoreductase [Candidatus Acidoferrales bacterium]|nr:SDR family NAD(P)-dependent oxidoreductase [Candidatus Acidoferrales bacterium]